MKIFFVSNVAWSLYNFRRGLMLELKARGHEVVVCAAQDSYAVRLQDMGFRYIPIALERRSTNIFKDAALFLSLVRIYRNEKPGLIFHNSIKPNIYGAMAAAAAGCRCINTVSGLGYAFIRKTGLLVVIRMLYRCACGCAQRTFFQNKDDRDLFIAEKLIEPGRCALVAGSGINTDLFQRKGSRQHLPDGKLLVFLYMGRLLWDKGIGELIEAVRMLKARDLVFKVRFLGMIDMDNPVGISREQVQQWQDEGLIEYSGDTMDVRPYLEQCDCLVLPSYREGTSKALLEAAAMELPVIAADVPGCRDVVEDGVTGFLVSPKDASGLAMAMGKIMAMTARDRDTMGLKARAKVVREYSEDIVIRTYCACIEEGEGNNGKS